MWAQYWNTKSKNIWIDQTLVKHAFYNLELITMSTFKCKYLCERPALVCFSRQNSCLFCLSASSWSSASLCHCLQPCLFSLLPVSWSSSYRKRNKTYQNKHNSTLLSLFHCLPPCPHTHTHTHTHRVHVYTHTHTHIHTHTLMYTSAKLIWLLCKTGKSLCQIFFYYYYKTFVLKAAWDYLRLLFRLQHCTVILYTWFSFVPFHCEPAGVNDSLSDPLKLTQNSKGSERFPLALHQCLLLSSDYCFPVLSGSLLLCYVVLPSSTWSSPSSLPSPWLPLCAAFSPSTVLHSCFMSGPFPFLFQCVFSVMSV